MTDVDSRARSLREMVRLLRAFEGWRCLPRIAVAAIAFGAIHLLPLIGAVAGIYVGANLKLADVVLGTVVSLGSGYLAVWISRRAPWRAILVNRIWTYEEPNPRGFVELLIQDEAWADTYRVLRRARFTPLYSASVGTPPPDAPDLTARIGVQEPEAWKQSTSDDDRLWRIASVLAPAGIRARVAGVNAFPDGQVEPRRSGDAALVGSSAS
jgi:hypothetical protein